MREKAYYCCWQGGINEPYNSQLLVLGIIHTRFAFNILPKHQRSFALRRRFWLAASQIIFYPFRHRARFHVDIFYFPFISLSKITNHFVVCTRNIHAWFNLRAFQVFLTALKAIRIFFFSVRTRIKWNFTNIIDMSHLVFK